MELGMHASVARYKRFFFKSKHNLQVIVDVLGGIKVKKQSR